MSPGPWPPELFSATAVLYRRRTLWILAAVLAAWAPFDFLRPQGTGLALALRAAWTATVLGAAALQRPAHPLAAERATQGAALLTGLITAAFVASQGGARSHLFGFLLALPLAILGFLPHVPSTALLAGAVTTAAGCWLLVRDGAAPAAVVEWAGISAVLGGLAAVATRANRRLLEEHYQAEQQRERLERELAESERRRERAERLALVGQLAAGVAHEINNPLAYVKANLGWLAARAEEGEAREVAQEALAGTARIAQIVADLRAFAREAPEELECFPAAEAVEEALRVVRPRLAGAQVGRALEAGALVRANRRWLVQALVNLLANAADALEGAAPERRWVRVELRREGAELLLAVVDGGPGIPEAVRARLFEPFFTTKGEKGTGLGLALTREQVERCGGRIEAGAEPGGGARFTLRLPAAEGEVTPPGASAAARDRPGAPPSPR